MAPDSARPARTVSTLLGHAHVEMALACLGSLRRYSAEPLALFVHDDGTLTAGDRDRLAAGLAGPEIVSRAEADERMGALLARHPAARAFRREHPLGLKLLDAPLLAAEEGRGALSYCDSDVLFLRPFARLFERPTAETGALFMADSQSAYSVRSWQVLLDRRLRLPARVNSGLIQFDLRLFDLDLAEWFLGRPEHRRTWAWIEQTCWALLAHGAGCRLWDPVRVAFPVEGGGPLPDAVALHFVSPLRGLLPAYLREARDRRGEPPVEVGSAPARSCGWPTLGRAEVRRRLARAGALRSAQPRR